MHRSLEEIMIKLQLESRNAHIQTYFNLRDGNLYFARRWQEVGRSATVALEDAFSLLPGHES